MQCEKRRRRFSLGAVAAAAGGPLAASLAPFMQDTPAALQFMAPTGSQIFLDSLVPLPWPSKLALKS